MAKDTKENNQLVKAKTSSLQKRDSNIVRRGLSDLGLLDVEKAESADEQAKEFQVGDKVYILTPDGLTDEETEQWVKLLSKTTEFYRNGQCNKAIEGYNKMIAIDPNYANGYRMRGSAYYKKGEYDRAIENYNKAIELDSNFAAAYNCCGLAYDKKGQYNIAIEHFNKAIALDLNAAYVYCNRGAAYERLGNKSMAISDFQKACDLGFELGCENLKRVLRQK